MSRSDSKTKPVNILDGQSRLDGLDAFVLVIFNDDYYDTWAMSRAFLMDLRSGLVIWSGYLVWFIWSGLSSLLWFIWSGLPGLV